MALRGAPFSGRAALLGGAIALEGPAALARGATSTPPLATDGAFSLGVVSGFPSPAGAVLWTRLDGLTSSARLTLEVARDAGFRNVVKRTTVTADAARDFTVCAPVGGLKAGEEYHYRFFTKRSSSPVGRLRTLRPADSREPVRVAVFSCQSYRPATTRRTTDWRPRTTSTWSSASGTTSTSTTTTTGRPRASTARAPTATATSRRSTSTGRSTACIARTPTSRRCTPPGR